MRRIPEVVADRQNKYGHPLDHWTVTVGMLNTLFADKLRPGEAFTPEDWGRMMICDKLARSLGPANLDDNWVDIHGYAVCVQMVGEERERRAAESP